MGAPPELLPVIHPGMGPSAPGPTRGAAAFQAPSSASWPLFLLLGKLGKLGKLLPGLFITNELLSTCCVTQGSKAKLKIAAMTL